MEEKIISEKERLRRERLAERRKAGYRAYIERKHKEMEEREARYRTQMEEKENVWAIPDFMEQVRNRNRIAATARDYIREEICR